jgi:hypothetical protein
LPDWLESPPLTREDASAVYGKPIPPEAWQRIERAYRDFGSVLDALAMLRLNRNPKDADLFENWAGQGETPA